jgi:hypothetical protein
MLALRTALLPPLRLSCASARTLRTSACALQQGEGSSSSSGGGGGNGKLFSRPGPPSLPPREQREFEKLVKEKSSESSPSRAAKDEEGNGASSTAREPDKAGAVARRTALELDRTGAVATLCTAR